MIVAVSDFINFWIFDVMCWTKLSGMTSKTNIGYCCPFVSNKLKYHNNLLAKKAW
jgi:hypothetical protein